MKSLKAGIVGLIPLILGVVAEVAKVIVALATKKKEPRA